MKNITFITDSNQYKYVVTNAVLILDQTNDKELFINIILNNLSNHELDKIKSVILKNKIEKRIFLHIYNDELPRNFKSRIKHISLSTYVRIFLPDILTNVDRTLYLDNDTVVIGDVCDAFNFFDPTKAYGRPWNQNSSWVKKMRNKNLLGESLYVNAGVMHLPLSEMRKNNFIFKALEFYKKNGNFIKFADQDILNSVFDKIYALPWFLNIARDNWPKNHDEYSKNTKLKIYHFLSVDKQWSTDKKLFEIRGRLSTKEREQMLPAKEKWLKTHNSIWKDE